jgi:hypothetical protein
MLVPHTEAEKLHIINAVKRAVVDPTKLTKKAYSFLHLANGFIAHYNKGGFISHYEAPGKLKDAILERQNSNQWSNFRENDKDYAYYMSKKDIYNRIVNAIK